MSGNNVHGDLAGGSVFVNGKRIDTETVFGPAIEEHRAIDAHTGIDITGPFLVTYAFAQSPSMVITAPPYVLTLVHARTQAGKVWIELKGHLAWNGFISVAILGPGFESVTLEGSGTFSCSGYEASALNLALTGSGDITVSGNAEKIQARLSGSGTIDSADLRVQSAKVILNGSGDVSVHAEQSAAVSLTGSGTVRVFGKPVHVEKTLIGSGDIQFLRH